MKQQVKRKTLSGSWTEFAFPQPARKYFVKNYTSGDILVTFENDEIEDEAFKIKTGIGEEVSISSKMNVQAYSKSSIFVKGTGEVEVQQLDF